MRNTTPKAVIDRLIARHAPTGVEIVWRTDGKWHPAWTDQAEGSTKQRMLSPYPDTPFKALVFLHECAHFANGSFRHEVANHLDEYQAELIAMAWWRSYGRKVPAKYLSEAKRYVRWHIKNDRKKGAFIAPHVKRWAAG